MTKIGDLLERDLNREIEEIIQVDQEDPRTVYTELTEYIATDSICEQYRRLLKEIAEAPASTDEGIGVWISGFFGSGKSSFAKNLGYALSNPPLEISSGKFEASALFKEALADEKVSNFVDFINAKIPTEVVMFDVSKGAEVRRGDEKIAEVVYRTVLRRLGYSVDYDIAELEIELEGKGDLERFEELASEVTGGLSWDKARKGAKKVNYASAILHRMEEGVFTQPDSWARSIRDRSVSLTVETIVDRIFELMQRRRPGRALVLIVDEVGQYVARSADKIEDLRALVEQLGKVGKNKVQAGAAPAPVWMVVTSQERLDEVVAAIDSKRVELAKLQDRFKHRIDMSPSDIREVATRRVLAKKDSAVPVLRELYRKSEGKLASAIRFDRSTVSTEITEEDFVQFYPYMPHFVSLSIDIMSGIRLQPGAPRHLGGSNRTIIKQAYEMLSPDNGRLAEEPVGTLVTMDRVFDLVRGNLRTEKQRDLQKIEDVHGSDSFETRVAKSIALLEFVRNLPRTPANLAACLVDEIGQIKPTSQVETALQALSQGQFVRDSEDGWKLQTDEEKNWETERRGLLDPRPRDRNEIVREALSGIFNEPGIRTYRYKNLRSFQVGILVDGVSVGREGQIPVQLRMGELGGLTDLAEQIRAESREDNDLLFWAFATTADLDSTVAELYASRRMISKYDQLRAQNKITGDEAALLQAEKSRAQQAETRLREKLRNAVAEGSGAFRGVVKQGAELGSTAEEALKSFFAYAVPDLYSKIEMGARPLSGDEAEKVLTAANLDGLPQVVYDGQDGLGLVTKKGAKYVIDTSAQVAQEVLNYLKQQHEYGNKVNGKMLEQHFGGIGYGWEKDILFLVLASLLRAGAIEVTYQGQRYRGHQDARVRVPLTRTPAFRSASFAPRESIDLKTLISAVKRFEEIAGEEIDVEEGAIASAFSRIVADEYEKLLPLKAKIEAHSLPVLDIVVEYENVLASAQGAPSDDVVRLLAGEGKTFAELRNRVGRIRKVVDDAGLSLIALARHVARQIGPALQRHRYDEERQDSLAKLQALLNSDELVDNLEEVRTISEGIKRQYQDAYAGVHEARNDAFETAIEYVKGHADWELVPEDVRDSVLAPLTNRLCRQDDKGGPHFTTDDARCSACGATLAQMTSDLAAVNGLRGQVLKRVFELSAEQDESPIERVEITEFFPDVLDTEEAVDQATVRFRDHLLKLLQTGVRIMIE